jgi:hypothetical protein
MKVHPNQELFEQYKSVYGHMLTDQSRQTLWLCESSESSQRRLKIPPTSLHPAFPPLPATAYGTQYLDHFEPMATIPSLPEGTISLQTEWVPHYNLTEQQLQR